MIKMSMVSGLLETPRFQNFCFHSAISIFVLIVVLGSLPGARENVGQYASGLVLHSVAYAVLALMAFLGGGGSRSRRALKATLTVAVMGALDEGVQSFFPYRTAAVTDWMVDVAAAGVVCALLWELWPNIANQLTREHA
jgi:VanZ family protein